MSGELTQQGNTSQRNIDRICGWLGWHEEERYWLDGQNRTMAHRTARRGSRVHTFDPFTAPGDCALVLQTLVERGGYFDVVMSASLGALASVCLQENDPGTPDHQGRGKTECEAKMNAFLKAIEDTGWIHAQPA